MGCHRNFWVIVKYIFEIHGSIFKPNKIWKSHLPFQQYMNKEARFQISPKSDNIWRNYITFSGSRSWIHLEVAVHFTAAPRWEPPPIDIIIFSPQNHWWWYLYLVFPSYCSLLEVNFLTAIIKMLIFVEKCIVKYLQQLHPPKNLSE